MEESRRKKYSKYKGYLIGSLIAKLYTKSGKHKELIENAFSKYKDYLSASGIKIETNNGHIYDHITLHFRI